MKTPACVLLGGNQLNRGVLVKLQSRGLMAIVVDWNREPELKGDLHLQVDVKDAKAVLAALEKAGDLDVRVSYTSIDVAVPTVVAIHKRYGLRVPQGPVYDVPITKAQMTTTWKANNLLNRLSVLIPEGAEGQLTEVARGKEVIVKPNLSSSSRGITILAPHVDEAQMRAALARAQRTSFDKQAVVEEFFRGREFTVEMLGDSEGHVAVYAISVKYHTAHAGSNKVANKLHYNSAAYPIETYHRIADYGRRCYQSLGLHCSFGHLEILMRDDGLLSPVEIGARSSGLIACPLVDVASGKDFLGDYMNVLRGGIVANEYYPTDMSSMYFFYDFPPGQCRRATHLCEHLAPGIESLYHDRSNLAEGKVYRMIDNDTERHGYEILKGRRDVLTIEAVDAAESRMLKAMFNGEIQ